MDKRVKLLKAMAHPSRLKIIEELKNGDMFVNQVKEMLEVDVSTASKHLSLLKSVNVVKSYQVGNTVYYKLTCSCISGFFDCLEKMIVER